MPIELKTKLIESNIFPVMTYGCQTWRLTEIQREKLSVTQHDMERKILNVRKQDKISLKKIRQLTKQRDILSVIDSQKFNWAGHVARMDQNRWPKKLLYWNPEMKRSSGRPKRRWEDEIRDRAGMFWKRKAQYRKKWRKSWQAL